MGWIDVYGNDSTVSNVSKGEAHLLTEWLLSIFGHHMQIESTYNCYLETLRYLKKPQTEAIC